MKYFAVHSNPSFGRWLWFFTFCIAGLLVLFWKGGPAESRVNSAADTSFVSSSSAHKPTESLTRGKFREIQDLRVGDRVLAENPEVGAEERAAYVEPDWRRWLQISLQMPKADGSVLEMELLRHDEWLIEQATLLVDEPVIEYVRADLPAEGDAEVEEVGGGYGPIRPAFADLGWRLELAEACGLVASGFVVQMDLPELGLTGEAVVVDIQPAPVVKAGAGRVVTATFKHSSGDVIDLVVAGDGSQETLGTTSNHPFWSVDRQDYVQAGKLELGERLQTYSGDTKRVVSKLARPGPEPVFNLEVHAEHVYYVGQQGLLVHNSRDYDDTAPRGGRKQTETIVRRMSVEEAEASRVAQGLVAKPGSRSAKWVSADKPQTTLRKKGHEVTVEFEVESGTKLWLGEDAIDFVEFGGGEAALPVGVFTKTNEPGAFGIGVQKLSEFNARVRRVKIK